MDEQLPFVVGGATRIDLSVFLYWLEWRRIPSVLHRSRHHVIVAVDQHRRLVPAGAPPLAVPNRVTGRGKHFCALQAESVHVRGQPFRCLLYVSGMSRIPAQTGDPQEFMQLVAESLRMVARILARLLAGRSHILYLLCRVELL